MTATAPGATDLGVRPPIDLESVPWVVLESEWGRSEFKILRASLRENCYTVMLRWAAGIQVPKHRHFGPVHAFTYRGRWHYREYDWFATAGSYVMEWPETEHSLVVDEDTEALFIVHGGQVDIGPNGETLNYQDAHTAIAGYQMLLATNGIDLPENIWID
ncbi:2,4'-dihydroxyacetophenone dioxygenase family protein [Mycobacterium sp.]|uniref:2,4'-dihydroxyacetophenone dioxygenase family protein n=1 Tax=Mycobacterium sp. TaxID=1785 RepID=UPI003D150A3F